MQAPTLVVRPERDHLVPEAWTERVAELIPHSELVVLPKAGHSLGARTATRLTALLATFMADGDQDVESEKDLPKEIGTEKKPAEDAGPKEKIEGAPQPAAG